MSGAKQAPVDSRAADALASNSQAQYNWTESNLGGVFNDLAGYNTADVTSQIGAAPTEEQARAAVLAEHPEYAAPASGSAGFGRIGTSLALKRQLDAAVASKMESMNADYQTNFAKTAQGLIKQGEQTKFGEAVNDAGVTADKNMAGAREGAERADSRLGLRQGGADIQALKDRVRAFSAASAKAGAENTTRRGLRDYSVARAQAASGVGNSIAQMGAQNLSGAAGIAGARNAANSQVKKGGFGSALLSGGMGALSGFIAGGAPGAAVGGAMGFAQGFG